MVSVVFKDWGAHYESVEAGSPVYLRLSGVNSVRNFYGYVHHIEPERTPGTNFTEVVLIGGSFPLKQQRQAVYKNITADQVAKQIAKQHGLVCRAHPHPRVYEQISQAGHSDWQLLVQLAHQSGYTLRTENTELYFEPQLQDFTSLRSEAPKFVMNDANNPEGSNMFSFVPLIGESLEFTDSQKAATAVSGWDKTSKQYVKNTVQKRNKTTRSTSKPEFFDRFDTLVVAPSAEIAQHEAKSAEDRNAFPYRAEVKVYGSPNLRPNMPVYLDGLGSTYSGYWTVLSAEHRVVETELNRHTYTTILTVGTDSLGKASLWTDNKQVVSPESTSKRTIIPNVKQTVVTPKTSLQKTSAVISPKRKGSFGEITNREKPTTVGQVLKPATWRSATPTLEATTSVPRKSPSVLNRLVQKGIL